MESGTENFNPVLPAKCMNCFLQGKFWARFAEGL